MNNLILGIKSFVLGITTLISTTTSPALTAPADLPTLSPSSQVVQAGMVTRSGEYSYSGHVLKYTLTVPQKGGDINGSFSGVCEGPITGKFAGGNGGNIEGSAQAKCSIAIFSYNLKVNYTGKLYLNEGKVDINWAGEIPYTQNSGNLAIDFEPVK